VPVALIAAPQLVASRTSLAPEAGLARTVAAVGAGRAGRVARRLATAGGGRLGGGEGQVVAYADDDEPAPWLRPVARRAGQLSPVRRPRDVGKGQGASPAARNRFFIGGAQAVNAAHQFATRGSVGLAQAHAYWPYPKLGSYLRVASTATRHSP